MSSSIVTCFLGAIQASVSVLLDIFYGVVAAQFQLLDTDAAKKVSTLCVKLFLPCLLVTNIGSQLNAESGIRYVPIIVWSLIYNAISIVLGVTLTRLFKMPRWVTPAVTFNNAIAMPLLLTEALKETGVLDSILWGPNDSASDAVTRAKSYFLVNAMITDSLTFGLGPKLLGGAHNEDGPDQPNYRADAGNSILFFTPSQDEESIRREDAADANRDDEEEDEVRENEQTSLLPNQAVRGGTRAKQEAHKKGKHWWRRLPPWAQKVFDGIYTFISPPLIGALIGATIGLVPGLQKIFFASSQEGGWANAWLTSSISNIGELFTALQIVVVGVKLSQSLMAMKKGEESGTVPWMPMVAVFLIRFILWPAISISVMFALATKTSLISTDPILWFALMIMPTGPPALKLTALADVTGSSEDEKMSIAKFLTVSYLISPLLSFTIVGALKASQAASAQ